MNMVVNVVLFQIGWFACVLGAMFGAVGGPLAYYAGEKLGAFTYADPLLALGAQAVGWGRCSCR